MKMPNANGMLTHQLTLEYPCTSLQELCTALNRQEFLVFGLFYKRTNMNGEIWWQDRGEIIINSSCIGKIVEFIDLDRDHAADEPGVEASFIRTKNQRYSK
jgi:hypothetical protein